MPEGPEVAITSQYLDSKMRGKQLTDIKVLSGRYKRTPMTGLASLKRALPLKVLEVNSRGKFMWFNLEERFDIWNTFGLTGMWRLEKDTYARIELKMGNKSFYFSDMRNFGTMKVSKDKAALMTKLRSLTPDFLRDPVNLSKINQYDTPVAALLMDQTKLGSGLGNYLVAESLYRARLSPHRLGSSLTRAEIKRLEDAIKYTIKLAYKDNHVGYMAQLEYDVKKINYHPEVKLGKDTFQFNVYQQKTDPKGRKVIADEIVPGRYTYWCPSIQK